MISALLSSYLLTPAIVNQPNVIYIMADDLGYGELGSYGQKLIKTPNIDQLAKEGVKFTQHYSGSPVCAPTRGSLLTGKSTLTSWVRENREFGDFSADGKEGQDPLPTGTYTVGTLMKSAGYKTAMIGKWGLGGPLSSGQPNQQGFDYFYGYNCQRQAHNFYPTHLWENENKVLLRNNPFNAHQKFPENLDPMDPKNYESYKGKDYSPDLMHKKALAFIKSNKKKPFFLMLTPTIPHVSLQVPDSELAQYNGVFDEKPYLGNQGYLPHIRPKSAYAAMITYLDKQVGEIMASLKANGLDQNTIVMFTSDNGPTWVSGVNPDDYNSTAGLRGRKAQIWEGGIRVPMIARWPGKIKAGSKTEHISAQWDLMATLSELTKVKMIEKNESISFLPTLLNSGKQSNHKSLYWEFISHRASQAVRIGDFKMIRFNRGSKDAKDTGHIYVYNLKTDPTESKDVCDHHPEMILAARKVFDSRVRAHYEPWNWD